MTNTTIIIKETRDDVLPTYLVILIVLGVLFVYLEFVSKITRNETVTCGMIKVCWKCLGYGNNQINTIIVEPVNHISDNILSPGEGTIVKYYQPNSRDIPKCSICCDSVTINLDLDQAANVDIVELSCNHYFHKRCLQGWIEQQQNSCPNCREDISVKNFYFYSVDSDSNHSDDE